MTNEDSKEFLSKFLTLKNSVLQKMEEIDSDPLILGQIDEKFEELITERTSIYSDGYFNVKNEKPQLSKKEFEKVRLDKKIMRDEGPRHLNTSHFLKPYLPITCEVPKEFLIRIESDLKKSIKKLNSKSLLYLELIISLSGSLLGATPSYISLKESGFDFTAKSFSSGFVTVHLLIIAIFSFLSLFFIFRAIWEGGQKSTQVEYLMETLKEINRFKENI